jgi:hypothetical protein
VAPPAAEAGCTDRTWRRARRTSRHGHTRAGSRANGSRHHYRLFCLLDYEAKGQDKPLLVVIDGRDKPFRTTLSASDYSDLRKMGDEYHSRNPRSLA